jgi:hypothetical protein
MSKKKVEPFRRQHARIGSATFKQNYSDGARITIEEHDTNYRDGKALRTTIINLDDRWEAMALYEAAREAVKWHRAAQAAALRTIDNCLAGNP